jgi:protein O-GlcNAc transferase
MINKYEEAVSSYQRAL